MTLESTIKSLKLTQQLTVEQGIYSYMNVFNFTYIVPEV